MSDYQDVHERAASAIYGLGAKHGMGKGSFLQCQGQKLQTWCVVTVGALHTYHAHQNLPSCTREEKLPMK